MKYIDTEQLKQVRISKDYSKESFLDSCLVFEFNVITFFLQIILTASMADTALIEYKTYSCVLTQSVASRHVKRDLGHTFPNFDF